MPSSGTTLARLAHCSGFETREATNREAPISWHAYAQTSNGTLVLGFRERRRRRRGAGGRAGVGKRGKGERSWLETCLLFLKFGARATRQTTQLKNSERELCVHA